jgi:hypothetical protein
MEVISFSVLDILMVKLKPAPLDGLNPFGP